MTVFLSKWRLVIEDETEMEEDKEEGMLRARVLMKPTSHHYYKVELYYHDELVFKLDTNPQTDPRMFMKTMEGRNPLEVLMEDANRERV